MDLRHDIHRELVVLRERAPEITGALTCTIDGMLVTTDLTAGPVTSTEQTAALTSALLSLSRKMTDLAQIGRLEETLISAAQGHTACYAAGPTLVLTVLAGPGANLGLLRIEGRRAADRIAAIAGRG
ncbi:roadblock/LC7 domain-containing protein [Microbispora sp. NBC_01189]|uniref:roadblock/LC7 domain-containing protein n=1 Tax=Microbispora sp. NBC_01189 TaxID=2903583 RepID=UPI002E14A87B|nr:roadblock/LC7 domain-containing protein [Microbispora sp. NBC_01189]